MNRALGASRTLGATFALLGLSRTAAAEDAEPPKPPSDVTEVRVKGDKADALANASGSQITISEKDLQRAQPQSNGEILRRVPGLHVRQEDAMGLRLNLGVRGFNPTRGRLVLLQEDGVPVVVSPYGEPELYYSTPIERVQSLEVVKGNDVLLYGPQTAGGVVNLRTWTPPTERTWSLEAEGGERGYRKVLARYGDAVGDARYVVQAFHKEGDGFRNMPFNVTDVVARVAIPTSSRGTATLKLVAYNETSHTTYVGLTEPMYRQDPRQPTVAPDDTFGVRRYEASLQHEERFSDKTVLRTTLFAYTMDLDLGQQDFDRTRVDGVDYARIVGPQGIDGAGLYFRKTRSLRERNYNVVGVEPQVEHRFETGDVRHKLLAGTRALVDIARRRSSAGSSPTAETGDLLSDDTTRIVGLSGYLYDRIAFRDTLLVTPVVRAEQSFSRRLTRRLSDDNGVHDVDLVGTTTSTGITPGIGLTWGKPVLNVFGGLHRGYSPPRISQSITPEGQSVALDAETSTNYELGTRAQPAKWLRLEATGFVSLFGNQLISNNTLSGSSAEFKNGGKTEHIGGELIATAQIGRALRLPLLVDVSAQYTASRSTFRGGLYDGNLVPYAPQHLATVSLDAEHTSGFGGQASWSYVGSQFADELNTIEPDISGRSGEIPAYQVLDTSVRYHHRPSGLTAHILVKNTLNDVYLASRLPNGIFTAGFRQVIVGLKWASP